jgi:D-proline reductase (dithiol) PrdB
VSLIARHLEANGIPTVIIGCARDIVEQAGVPRLVWSDFPLGNSAGKPNDLQSQRDTLALALDLFASATGPRTTTVSTQTWMDKDDWKLDFMNIDALPAERIEKLKADFAEQKRVANQIKNRS